MKANMKPNKNMGRNKKEMVGNGDVFFLYSTTKKYSTRIERTEHDKNQVENCEDDIFTFHIRFPDLFGGFNGVMSSPPPSLMEFMEAAPLSLLRVPLSLAKVDEKYVQN